MPPIRCRAGASKPEVPRADHCVTCHPAQVSYWFEWINGRGQQGYTVSPLSPCHAFRARISAMQHGQVVTHCTALSAARLAPLLQSRSAALEPLPSQGTRKHPT